MAAVVKIPTQLRLLTGGKAQVEIPEGTVHDVLKELEIRHPGIGERILDGTGAVRRFVNVYVDNEDIRFEAGLSTVVAAGAEVAIIPAVAGG